MSSLHILLLSVLIGFITTLPTGPMGAYIIARRIEHSLSAMVIAILAAVSVNAIAIALIQTYGASLARIQSDSVLPIIFGAILIITLGCIRIIHPGSFARPSGHQLSQLHQQFYNTIGVSTLIRTFGTGFIINTLNPMMAITIISLLTTFQILGVPGSVLPIIGGFCIGAGTQWAMTDFLIEASLRHGRHDLSIILHLCGIVMVVSGFVAIGNVL